MIVLNTQLTHELTWFIKINPTLHTYDMELEGVIALNISRHYMYGKVSLIIKA